MTAECWKYWYNIICWCILWLIILQKILDSDWSRAVQLRHNTSAESCNTSAELCNTSANYNSIKTTKYPLKLNIFGIFYYLENNFNFLNISICTKFDILQKYSRNLEKNWANSKPSYYLYLISHGSLPVKVYIVSHYFFFENKLLINHCDCVFSEIEQLQQQIQQQQKQIQQLQQTKLTAAVTSAGLEGSQASGI